MGTGVGNVTGDVFGTVFSVFEPVFKPVGKVADVVLDPFLKQVGVEGVGETIFTPDTWDDLFTGMLGGDDFSDSTGRSTFRSDGTKRHEEKSLMKQAKGMGKHTTSEDQQDAQRKINNMNKMPWDKGRGLL